MSYDIDLKNKDGQVVSVDKHEEGGTYCMGGYNRSLSQRHVQLLAILPLLSRQRPWHPLVVWQDRGRSYPSSEACY